MPNVDPIPTVTMNPTFPFTSAQIPKAVPIGSIFGYEEIFPKTNDL